MLLVRLWQASDTNCRPHTLHLILGLPEHVNKAVLRVGIRVRARAGQWI